MQNIIIDFAKEQDELFLLNNSKLNSEGFNRKDFEDRTRGLNPHDSIIIKPVGEIIEPESDFFPRSC